MTVRVPIRLLILSAAVAASLSACNRDEDKARAPVPPAKGDISVAAPPAGDAAPLTYESATPYAEVDLSLPSAITAQPDLHAVLYRTAVRNLREFNEGAQGDRTEAGDDTGQLAYVKSIVFAPAAQTARLFGLTREDYEFTGGAHGNTQAFGVIWDKTAKRQLQPTALFRPGTDLNSLNPALCAAINAEKRTREGTEPVTADGTVWACPEASKTPFTLAPGTNGKAGGLMFLIGPYIVGPYVEGSYEVVVPTSVIAPMLAPDYAGEFG